MANGNRLRSWGALLYRPLECSVLAVLLLGQVRVNPAGSAVVIGGGLWRLRVAAGGNGVGAEEAREIEKVGVG